MDGALGTLALLPKPIIEIIAEYGDILDKEALYPFLLKKKWCLPCVPNGLPNVCNATNAFYFCPFRIQPSQNKCPVIDSISRETCQRNIFNVDFIQSTINVKLVLYDSTLVSFFNQFYEALVWRRYGISGVLWAGRPVTTLPVHVKIHVPKHCILFQERRRAVDSTDPITLDKVEECGGSSGWITCVIQNTLNQSTVRLSMKKPFPLSQINLYCTSIDDPNTVSLDGIIA